MLKWSSNQARILRKKEENERFKRQQQFKNDLNKAGKNEQKIIEIDKNFVFEKNKSKINNIAFQDIFKPSNHKCPWI